MSYKLNREQLDAIPKAGLALDNALRQLTTLVDDGQLSPQAYQAIDDCVRELNQALASALAELRAN